MHVPDPNLDHRADAAVELHTGGSTGDAPGTPWRGHSVVQVPVPPLEAWVRARTAHYDEQFVSRDPRFAHAHVTVLAPWLSDPAPPDLDWLAGLAAATPAFDVTLARVAAFPDGVIHAVPQPDAPLRALTAATARAYPDHPPYGGRFGRDVDPHVTLDRIGAGVSLDSTTDAVTHLLPVTFRVDRLQLTWWESGNCHVVEEWLLGGPGPT